jgi:hypothetical protein
MEVRKAMELGYQITEIFEVWNFEQRCSELFKDYIYTFLKIKQESSGFPAWVQTERDKQAYMVTYEENQGIKLETDKIAYNPGRRAIAKLSLNSLWGKFGQRDDRRTSELVYDKAKLYSIVKTCIDVQITWISEEAALMSFKQSKQCEDNFNTNIFIAAFTTSYARLKLYSVLEQLQERVLYCDTDSVIYTADLNCPQLDLPLNDLLGGLTNEIKNDGHLTGTWVAGGPKNYAFTDSNGKCSIKVKGISLDSRNSTRIDVEKMELLVRNHMDSITFSYPNKIQRTDNRKVISRNQDKKLYFKFTKRVMSEEESTLNTYPFGY